MSLQHLGSLSLGECVPTTLAASVELTAAINLALPQLQAKIAGLLSVQVALTVKVPALDALIVALQNVATQVAALLAAPPPSIGLSLSVVAKLLAELNVDLGTLQAKLAFAASLSVALGTPGIEAYRYEGRAGSFPSELGPEFTSGMRIGGGPNLPIYAIVLVATDGGAIQAMKKALVS